jgi:tRNA wybutosine-synthesizing protein 2
LSNLPGSLADDTETILRENLVARAPKRWVIYEPMMLLPSGSFSSSAWTELLQQVDSDAVNALWSSILESVSQKNAGQLTHLAINEGIPLNVVTDTSTATEGADIPNLLRSPTGLRILFGDFGPDSLGSGSATDFDTAFWVSTRQNGIYQTWAPRWTMFSRGNVKEKARLLAFHDEPASLSGDTGLDASTSLHRRIQPRQSLQGKWAVDMYAGIGYFVFSYAKLGLKVLCWELNPWSVEGLQRGARMNRLSVKVVKNDDLTKPTAQLVTGQQQIVVFLEDNHQAERRIAELRAAESPLDLDIVHVNCGLLPSSTETWRPAWSILSQGKDCDAWLHLHENVAAEDIGHRRREIQSNFDGWSAAEAMDSSCRARTAIVEHVELVKTFAPGVWHVVFDVLCTRRSDVV